MSRKHFESPDAGYFFDWQEMQRYRTGLPDFCIRTLERIRKNAQELELQEKDSIDYRKILSGLHSDKEKFYRQLMSVAGNNASAGDVDGTVPPFSRLNCSHYTLDSWIRSQGGTRGNYMEFQTPYSLDDFQFSTLMLSDIDVLDDGRIDHGPFSPDAELRVVVIDEEYYSWLKNKQMEDNEKARLKYINTISDDEADRLLHKNHLDVTYSVCAIPLGIVCENDVLPVTEWELSGKTKTIIRTCLMNIFGETEVYLPGTAGKLDDVRLGLDELIQQADRYFRKGFMTEHSRNINQKHNRNTMLAAVPFVVRYIHESASVPFRDVLEAEGAAFRQNLNPARINFPDRKHKTAGFPFGAEIPVIYEECADIFPADVSFESEGISAAIRKDISRPDVHVMDPGVWIRM